MIALALLVGVVACAMGLLAFWSLGVLLLSALVSLHEREWSNAMFFSVWGFFVAVMDGFLLFFGITLIRMALG